MSFVETGDAVASYKAAYDTDGMLPATIKRSAWDVRHNAKVAARIHQLRGAIASTFVLNEAALKLAAFEIAEADPTVLQHVRVFACSMCWSDQQLAREVSRYLASVGTSTPLAPPNTFTPTDDPFAAVNPLCESCMGAGPHRDVHRRHHDAARRGAPAVQGIRDHARRQRAHPNARPDGRARHG